MSKSASAFRTITEVSTQLGIAPHVLRFWEQKFPQIKPMKRGGGRRYYRPEDVALIAGIHVLLRDQGLTIRGARQQISDQGITAIQDLGRDHMQQASTPEMPDTSPPAPRPRKARKTPAPAPLPLFDGADDSPAPIAAPMPAPYATDPLARLAAALSRCPSLQAPPGADPACQARIAQLARDLRALSAG